MDRIAFSLLAILLILIAILFVVPQDKVTSQRQKSADPQTVKIQRHTIELERVENVRITPEGILRFSGDDGGNHLRRMHYFINLNTANVTLVEDDEFAKDRIQMSDTIIGGLQITLASSHELDLEGYTASDNALSHNLSASFIETSAESH
ncbi:hypothetical protein [Gimesia panareensis]|uniref:Uncharacterized protein n=1 Tax=Gimesia panareensis TaxID=2527978 RepID=A0A518ACR9_9PLAN|nr:hypothetical protein [Gimesia panareensis]QDT29482.1 hypothetical protein Enr10x_48370 [Gimesia panareensis]QDU52527.1 hypothetical protein Pan110_49070 [Gimesia panareensis]